MEELLVLKLRYNFEEVVNLIREKHETNLQSMEMLASMNLTSYLILVMGNIIHLNQNQCQDFSLQRASFSITG